MTTVLLDDNKKFREYTGVQKFHDKGYYGERVCAGTGESWKLSYYNPDDNVFDPTAINSTAADSNTHAVKTAATFFQCAPKAKLYMIPTTGRIGSTLDNWDFMTKGLQAIKDYNITNMFTSLSLSFNSVCREEVPKALAEVPDFNWFVSAGNDSSEKFNTMMYVDEITGVGAYIIDVNGNISKAGYTSESELVDFAAPSMIRINVSATKPSDQGGPQNGTSFSAPWLCGMACLVDDFFIDKTGKPLTRDMMRQFMLDHTVDIHTEGFDDYTGWGAVVLPDPDEIDINKYRSERTVDSFVDKDQMSSWAIDGIEYCLNNGLMNGVGENKFDPKGYVTREQLATVVARMHQDLK